MAYKNSSSVPTALPETKDWHLDTPLEAYDLNWVFPVRPLSTSKLRVEPFIPSVHAELLWQELCRSPALFTYLGYGPFGSRAEWLTWLEATIRRDPTVTFLAIRDLTKQASDGRPGKIVGSIALMAASRVHLQIEIGHVLILPEAQRTHVTTHATCLLLAYILNPSETSLLPSQDEANMIAIDLDSLSEPVISNEAERLLRSPGLGCRKAIWIAHAMNDPSNSAATKMGFSPVGLLEYDRVISPHKPAERFDWLDNLPRETTRLFGSSRRGAGFGTPEAGVIRHSRLWHITCKSWAEGLNETIAKKLDRVI
ncbi:uncharacterized protein L969DRAFT_92993 [Mixia osmundae IAM 14324]|uniref:N-acetyltransferase domain-containing protein n=1 Tax=Mixia osmundae (strain CBS 9802 / IAM 14324 / JCM 22182 / KY 12970) TaxID=764103 RepID=G7DU03_MIXOS|nr:uncharacterized protein L969DRAFT_92993 [Mixia osmundae IAM 14324]KEI41776.1 hypothetical protein L969DRAFT_92993 [Mixia osmundae IAM 14324]GAA94063.1 hypothetical protein E5Q_00710 [Mixia osmundae IAM 14324]